MYVVFTNFQSLEDESMYVTFRNLNTHSVEKREKIFRQINSLVTCLVKFRYFHEIFGKNS